MYFSEKRYNLYNTIIGKCKFYLMFIVLNSFVNVKTNYKKECYQC